MNDVYIYYKGKYEIIMGIAERKERERAEMRKKILNAALDLFIESGYEAISIRNIAEKIEYSTASIYSYFQEKADIIFELHLIAFDELFKHQLSAQEIDDPRERLLAHGRAYLNFALEHPQLYELIFIVRLPKDKLCQPLQTDPGFRSYELLVKNVVECQEVGYFAGQDPTAIAYLTWSTVHGMAALYIRDRLQFIAKSPELVENFVASSAQILRTLVR